MKFACPQCGQPLETETLYAGQTVQCPSCGAGMRMPEAAGAVGSDGTPPPSDQGRPAVNGVTALPPAPEVIQTLQSSINRGVMTITQYMADKQIEGVIDLQSTEDKSTASSVLTAEQGRKYKLGDVVATGGMGAILDAKDVNLRRSVAMKVMLEPDKVGKDQILRFIQEAQVTSQVEHPSIVPIYELGVDASGNVFYTMKFVKGRTLSDILDKIREGDAETINEYPLVHLLTIFQKVCDAIAFAHSKRVIHRDLKPENVMVGDYGEVLVMDWGLAKVLPKKKVRKQPGFVPPGTTPRRTGDSAPSPAGIDSVRSDEIGDVLKTMDGSIMGTPGFMAPEQAAGKTEEIDREADIYSLGAILYNILTLRPPVTGKTLAEILDKVTKGEIKRPAEYNDRRSQKPESRSQSKKTDESRVTNHVSLAHLPDQRVPESLSAVAMKALDVNPYRRYSTVKELQRDIEAYQGGFATKAEDAGAWKQFALFVKRNKAVVGTFLTMMVVLFVAVGVYTRANVKARIMAEKEQAKASEALRAFEEEKGRGQKDRKSSAPALVRSAKMFIEQKNFEDALTTLQTAIEYDPGLEQAWLLKVAVMLHLKQREEALKQCMVYQQCLPADPNAKRLLSICRKACQPDTAAVADTQLATLLREWGAYTLAAEFVTGEKDRLELYRARISKAWPGAGGKLSLNAVDGLTLELRSWAEIADLAPLKGIPLTKLDIRGSQVSDLASLRDMPLVSLNVESTSVADLSPLDGMRLQSLDLTKTPVADLSKLKGMPLTVLHVSSTKVTDLSPLRGMPLTRLDISHLKLKDCSVLRGMPLKTLAATNMRFDDLSVLKGMSLSSLSVMSNLELKDISPLRDMPLEYLNLCLTSVHDLSPLKDAPLTELNIMHSPADDLSPLKSCKSLKRLIGGENVLFKKMMECLASNNLAAAEEQCNKIITNWQRQNVPAADKMVETARLYLKEHIPTIKSGSAAQNRIPSQAVPFGGHHYLLQPVEISWQDADSVCKAFGGHMVTINSVEEEKFIIGLRWSAGIVGFNVGFKANAEGKPQWVTGEPWMFGERVQILTPAKVGSYWDSAWRLGGGGRSSFIIEWDR